MLGIKGRLVLAIAAACAALAQTPPLTTVQDILYTADGNRYNGLATITWKSFDTSTGASIAAETRRVSIVNGSLYVQLAPTTTSSTPASYTVVYHSAGRIQFLEYWVVPPSETPLRVKDVRLGPGGVTTPGNQSQPPLPVQMGDVAGLQAALAERPGMGTGYATSRVAVINAVGALDGAAGPLSDCMHVDGSSGPCGVGSGGGGSDAFIDLEAPGGAVNGSNGTFTLVLAPNPGASLSLYRNGLMLKPGLDYTLAGRTVTFLAGAIPQSGDTLLASYRLVLSLAGIGFVDAEAPAGALNGANTVFSLAQAPDPAGSLLVYRNGMLQKPGLDYTLSGNTLTFSAALIPQIGDHLLCFYRVKP